MQKDRRLAIDFHVTSADYFGTLATILGLIADSVRDADASAKRLTDLKDELVYMQERYTIKPKIK